jgi:hypothetical protein
VAIVGVLLVAGTATGVTAKVRADREEAAAQAAQKAAAERKAAARAAEAERIAEEQAEAERAAAAKRAAANAERRQRRSIIRQMQQSITKDARDEVESGMLDGPIFYTACDPLGGGSADDLTALTTTFECIAVNEKLGGGQVRGYVYSATANWDEASWSWRLGS